MIKISFILIFLLGFFYPVSSQWQNKLVNSSYYPHELSIMISPINPNQIVIGCNVFYFQNDTSISGYSYSTNGGLSWSSGVLHSSVARPSGDPVILVDTTGYFYFLQLGNYNVDPWWDRLLIVKSTNGGMNWSQGTVIGRDSGTVQDKPWGCVDFSHSPYRNNIYVTWTRFSEYLEPGPGDSSIIMFSKSTNGAQSWSAPVRISELKGNAYDSSNTVEGAVPCTGPNGEIYVSWAGPKIINQQNGIFFDRSTDGGNTWFEHDIYAADMPGGWAIWIPPMLYRCNGFPITACDLSNGPHRGTIYINWSDKRNGPADCDIWLVKSTNGGFNWSQPKRVNNDPPGKQQFFTWMTIDQVTGYLYIVFYDQRNTTSFYADVYVARSTDGGETFENVKVNSNAIQLNSYIYDYIGISAYNGKIRPAWSGTGVTVWTAIIDTFYNIGIKNITSEIPVEYKLFQNYPNPFNPVTKIRFDLPKSNLTLSGAKGLSVIMAIFDIIGREISVLVNEQLSPGTYEVEWDASNYPSGVYFYKLTMGDYTETKKMILSK